MLYEVITEPDGILKAWTTKARMKSARKSAMTSASAYSLISLSVLGFISSLIVARLEGCKEGFLGQLDVAHALHAALAFLLFS